MENYHFSDHLVVKLTDPNPNYQPGYEYQKFLNPHYSTMPTLYLFAKAADLDKFEKILNELAANYINDEKLFVYVINGEKARAANTWYAKYLPDAGIFFWSTNADLSERFSSFSRESEMTKDRLKTWLDRQMTFISKQPFVYDEDRKCRISYIIVENDEGMYKLWSAYRDIPQGWKKKESTIDFEDKAACIEYIERLKAEALENQEEVEEDPEEMRRRALAEYEAAMKR